MSDVAGSPRHRHELQTTKRDQMVEGRRSPPPGAGKAAVLIGVIVAVIIVSIFVGLNSHHAKTLREQQSGHIDAKDVPKSTTDLQSEPVPRK